MKKKAFFTHLLGSLLILFTIYHSYTLYSIIVVLPFALVSYSVQEGWDKLLFPSLILATLVSSFFITAGSMDEIFSLLVFSSTFALPLFLYWIIALQEETDIKWKPLGIALSYVLFTAMLFYLLPELLDVFGSILSSKNRVTQTLMFFGSGMIVAVSYHVILEFKR